jgi:hypothetical protein
MEEFLQKNNAMEKMAPDYYLSKKYHATTQRLQSVLDTLKETKRRFQTLDLLAYKALLESAIITYMGCFNDSKLLLKQEHIPLDKILKGRPDLIKTHKKVKKIRNKIIAYQDKEKELSYDIDLIITKEKIVKFNFPYSTLLDFNIEDIKNFFKLITIICNYLDIERQEYDNKLLEKIKKINVEHNIYDFCIKNEIEFRP